MSVSKEQFWQLYQHQREDDGWDYKQNLSVSTNSERAEFAKDVLAFSNYGGGFLLLGLEKETYDLEGVDNRVDPATLGSMLEKRIGIHIDIKLLYFNHLKRDSSLVRLGILYIPPSNKILVSQRDLHGSKPNSPPIVQEGAIYYRRNTESIRASTDNIETILKRTNSSRETQQDFRNQHLRLKPEEGSMIEYSAKDIRLKVMQLLALCLVAVALIALGIRLQLPIFEPLWLVIIVAPCIFFWQVNQDILSTVFNRHSSSKRGVYLSGGRLAKCDSEGGYIISRPIGRPCKYPGCDGTIYLVPAPPREQARRYVGICTKSEDHSYLVDANGYALPYPEMDWSLPPKPTRTST